MIDRSTTKRTDCSMPMKKLSMVHRRCRFLSVVAVAVVRMYPWRLRRIDDRGRREDFEEKADDDGMLLLRMMEVVLPLLLLGGFGSEMT